MATVVQATSHYWGERNLREQRMLLAGMAAILAALSKEPFHVYYGRDEHVSAYLDSLTAAAEPTADAAAAELQGNDAG